MERKISKWRRLDNAAKIFPATSSKKDTRVFRFSCELKEQVDGILLQKALDQTMEIYPLFQSVLRKGLFWFYLEQSSARPVVRETVKPPCSTIYIPDKKSLLFEVTYYKKNIHFEVFHALTDGTGATRFLRELVKQYLLLAHPEEFPVAIPLEQEEPSEYDIEDDGFAKYHTGRGSREKLRKPRAYQIRGRHTENGELAIEERIISTKALLGKAKEYGVSISVFLSAILICAIHREMRARQRHQDIVLMVPVNLRKFFPSESMLNFFGWIEPGFRFESGQESFEDVLRAMKGYFKKELTLQRVEERMNDLTSLEHHPLLRVAPLELKNLFLQAGTILAAKEVSAVYSNMGVVTMPEEYARHIELFHVYTSTPKVELTMCSFQDRVVLSFTSRFENRNIQRYFFQILEQTGVETCVYQEERPPKDASVEKKKKFMQVFSFCCVVLTVLMFMSNRIFTPEKTWFFFGAGGVFCMWLVLAVGYVKRRNLLKNAMWQQVLIVSGCLLWDFCTGWRGWSVDYVFPGVSIATIGAILIIRRMQRLEGKDYMIYYILAGLCGLIPGILLAAGCVHIEYPSVISAGVSVLFLAGIMIFKGKELKMELHKNLHV